MRVASATACCCQPARCASRRRACARQMLLWRTIPRPSRATACTSQARTCIAPPTPETGARSSPFPAHHPYRAGDLDFGDTVPVLMTEKDAVKCKRFARPHHWVLPVHAELDPAFGEWLLKALGERRVR